nr:hypothetical protein Iba_scaffold2661CG0390 [Ipomoea batatas]
MKTHSARKREGVQKTPKLLVSHPPPTLLKSPSVAIDSPLHLHPAFSTVKMVLIKAQEQTTNPPFTIHHPHSNTHKLTDPVYKLQILHNK